MCCPCASVIIALRVEERPRHLLDPIHLQGQHHGHHYARIPLAQAAKLLVTLAV
jgi:hypothetical protein